MTPGSPTFDVEDAAQYLKVSERTVRRLVASRAIRHRRVAGLVRFTREDLENYVESTLVAAET
jgi:excisionase family DNA binding protein